MSEGIVPQDLLQPFLLQRLTDPDAARDFGVDGDKVRRAIERELLLLLQTRAPAAIRPELAGSVLNYGLPPRAGTPLARLELDEVKNLVRLAIQRFEPRVIASTLTIEPSRSGGSQSAESENWGPAQLALEITADVRVRPAQRIHLEAVLDLDSGHLLPREPQDG